MFKLIVLSALFAAAVGEPGVFYSSPLATTYAASIAAPVASTYVQHSTSYVAPTVYSDIAYPHLIKKRSPQLLSNYVAPWVAGSPLVTPYASTYVAPAPITYSSSVLPAIATPAHFIKKRSPQLLSNYVAPWVAGSPLVTPYASTLVSSAPITYSSSVLPAIATPTHFIKKRSPQLLSNYVAPWVAGSPLVTPYASTLVAPTPITYSSSVLPAIAAPAHFIKKRSAALLGAPATYIAGTPLASTYVASAPVTTSYSSSIIPSASYYSAFPGYVAGLPLIKK